MKNDPENRAPGDSSEQQQAESLLLDALGMRLRTAFTKKRFTLPDGGWLEIDGVSESPPALCEAWAHHGRPKSAQKNKVMTDAMKLLQAGRLWSGHPRLILLFADEEAASHFKGQSWMAQALRTAGIEVEVVDLPEETRRAIRIAQERQFR